MIAHNARTLADGVAMLSTTREPSTSQAYTIKPSDIASTLHSLDVTPDTRARLQSDIASHATDASRTLVIAIAVNLHGIVVGVVIDARDHGAPCVFVYPIN